MNIRFFPYVLLAALIVLGTSSVPAKAQDIAEQSCDPQFWRQMSARAWMEAEREIMMNQNLIFKPDSVLEYTCFDQFLSRTAWDAGNIFVHTKYYGQEIIPRSTEQSMETTLNKIVYEPMKAFLSANFEHSFLGGRASQMGATPSDRDGTDGMVPPTDRVDYNCKVMASVWRTAKCANFVDNSAFENTDGFYPFEALKAFGQGEDVGGYAGDIEEVRQFPSSMACSGGLGPAGSWQDQISLAENANDDLYSYSTPLGQIYSDVAARLAPVGDRPAMTCGAAIDTGIQVKTSSSGAGEDDKVCTNPGCIYKGGQCVEVGS